MNLTGELLALHHKENDYVGDESLVGMVIEDKELHTVSAATKAGKSTIIERVVKILPDSALASSITDRKRKDGDSFDPAYLTLSDGMTTERIKFLINEGALVNFAVLLETGDIYGSLPEGYPALHNFLPTLPRGIIQLSNAAFKRETHSYVTLPGNAWRSTLGPKVSRGRMEEAIVNFTYAEDHANDLEFVRNRIGPAGLAHAANTLINISVGSGKGDDKNKALEDVSEMMVIAKDLAVALK